MEGFFYSDNRTQHVTTTGQTIGELDLVPGKYVVFAKARIATNSEPMSSGDPIVAGGGLLRLEFAGIKDDDVATLTTNDHGSGETMALIVASEISSNESARLSFYSSRVNSTLVMSVRIIALSLTNLNAPPSVEDSQLVVVDSWLLDIAMRTGDTRALSQFRDRTRLPESACTK
jgi:hypothetical protein